MNVKKGQQFLTAHGNGISVQGNVVIANKSKECVIEAPCYIGNGSIINSRYIGAFGYFSGPCRLHSVQKIGRFCMINQQVVAGFAARATSSISAHSVFSEPVLEWADSFYTIEGQQRRRIHELQKKKELYRKKDVTIGNDVWIGHAAQIMAGVSVADGAIIGAGSIVTKDVPAYSVTAGNPARVIRYRFEEEIIQKLLKLQWWKYGPDIWKGIDITNPREAVKRLEEIVERAKEYTAERFRFDNSGGIVYRQQPEGEEEIYSD